MYHLALSSDASLIPSNMLVVYGLNLPNQDSKDLGLRFTAPSPFDSTEDFICIKVLIITKSFCIIGTYFTQVEQASIDFTL